MRSSCTARYAKRRDPDDDYPWAPTWDERVQIARELEETWGDNVDLSSMWPNAAPDEATWFQRRGRASLSPCGCARSHPHELEGGRSRRPCRPSSARLSCSTAPAIATPTWRRAAISPSTFQERVSSSSTATTTSRSSTRTRSLTRSRSSSRACVRRQSTDRVLATVLFTDLVGSTERATTLGDAAWASLLARHDATVRDELARFGGEEIDTAGDGFLAHVRRPGARDSLRPLDPRRARSCWDSTCVRAPTRARWSGRPRASREASLSTSERGSCRLQEPARSS